MAAAPVSLDQGPPLPPQLQAPQQASAQQLAGRSATPNGSASLQEVVIEKLMFVEKALQSVAQMMPAAAGPVNGVIDMLRKGMGTVLAQGAQPPPAQGLGAGASSLLQPGGAPTS